MKTNKKFLCYKRRKTKLQVKKQNNESQYKMMIENDEEEL